MSSSRTTTRYAQATAARPPSWSVGAQWDELRFRQPGWVVLPLRAFLGVTFIYASLQKLANPTYLDPHNRASVVGQMQSLRHSSPIGPLLSLSLHAPKLVGLLIAFGELAVALGILLGLFTRLAALGGMLLSLTFLLTVSWKTTPYYYGSDVVFLFAWTVFLGLGSGGVLSLDALFHERAVRMSRGRNSVPDLARREVLLRARAAGVVAAFAGVTGLFTALIGRAAGGTKGKGASTLGATTPSSPTPTATATKSTSASGPAPGTAIGRTSQVPVGQAGQFTDPASGDPAWVVHPTADKFVAFSAVCTHAGCPVQFDKSNLQFVCPCHGGTYDAQTGQVLGGPPPSPLPAIPVHIVNGEIRVD